LRRKWAIRYFDGEESYAEHEETECEEKDVRQNGRGSTCARVALHSLAACRHGVELWSHRSRRRLAWSSASSRSHSAASARIAVAPRSWFRRGHQTRRRKWRGTEIPPPPGRCFLPRRSGGHEETRLQVWQKSGREGVMLGRDAAHCVSERLAAETGQARSLLKLR